MHIPEAYVIQKLFSFAKDPTFNRLTNQYNAGCPKCKEGRSFGRKKRLFFYVKTNTFHCFNCNITWNAYKWLTDVCRLTYNEIEEDLLNQNYRVEKTLPTIFYKNNIAEYLPKDSINLSDDIQTKYYKDNIYVQKALELIKIRKLNTAINKPKSFYISLTDNIHKNRLCIPFYDIKKNISYYQTRCLDNTSPKYLSKLNDRKKIYGIDNINKDIDYIYIFEGPIDSMFVQNGIAITGLNLTKQQEEDLSAFPFHKKIWVLDNQNIDLAAKEKTDSLISKKESVFIWPSNIKCKDFNELSILLNQSSISHKFILKNTKIF